MALQLQPTRGALEAAVPTDPTIYRFYEVLQVYGPTIKVCIHEEFGDGIMSAINFRLDVRRGAMVVATGWSSSCMGKSPSVPVARRPDRGQDHDDPARTALSAAEQGPVLSWSTT